MSLSFVPPIDWFWKQLGSPTLALEDSGARYSGPELFRAVSVLARALESEGVAPGQRVGVLCGKRASQVMGMLGTMSVGAVYVPLSLQNPQGRLDYFLENCGIEVIIVEDETIRERLDFGDRRVIAVTPLLASRGADALVPSIPPVKADDVAYIIYTSGSTGNPKGVVIRQDSLCRLLQTADETFVELDASDRMLQVVDFSFDVSIWDIALWLSKGATLYVLDMGPNVFRLVTTMLERRPAYICNAAPTYSLLMNIHSMWKGYDFSFLKSIITTASYCPPRIAKQLLEAFPSAKLYNCYGPTETTVYCCWTEVTAESVDLGKPLSIGYPLPGLEAFLFDGSELRRAEEVPEGVERELCIAGTQVFQEYWGAPELTRSKLLRDGEGRLAYRTGDLVTRRGREFYYFGRSDDTIKVAGFRVNLGEIELCIGSADFVQNCAVVDRTDAKEQVQLTAFYSLRPDLRFAEAEDSERELRKRCEARLAPYMIPKKFVRIDEFPMSIAGKIDRKALRLKIG